MPDEFKFKVRPLYMQVHDELVLQIASGAWKAGEYLPSEQQLAEQYGISLGTMRKALQYLEGKKIVCREQGRGTRVVDQNNDSFGLRYSSIFDDHDQLVAGDILDCSAELCSPTEDEGLHLSISSKESVLKATSTRVHNNVPFMRDIAVVPARRFPGVTPKEMTTMRLSAMAQRHAILMGQAREFVEPILCPQELLAVFQIDEPRPILLLKRIAYDIQGDPVQYRIAWCYLRAANYVCVTH